MTRIALVLIFAAVAVRADTGEKEIRQALDTQVAAWNRGDIPAFVETYDDSPDTLFVGKEISRGRAQVLARYLKTYSDPAKMGRLSFSDLEVKTLGAEYANVVGRFHLARDAAGGGNAEGIFTLLFRRTALGWKIVQDHTS